MSKILALISTGVIFGIIHVITGPDHLSALATLSVNVPNRYHAFCLGIRWGIGHSTGLLLVAVLLILFYHPTNHTENDSNTTDTIQVPEVMTTIFESFVGVFMIFLGTYGIVRAWDKRSASYRVIPSVVHPTSTAVVASSMTNVTAEHMDQRPPTPPNPSNTYIYPNDVTTSLVIPTNLPEKYHSNSSSDSSSSSSHNDVEMSATNMHPTIEESNQSHHHHHDDTHHHSCTCCCSVMTPSTSHHDESIYTMIVQYTSRISTQCMAFVAGIIHGLAGPGGVLGVIPAIQLQNNVYASIYLSCFCITSTMTMGVFAICYASCSSYFIQHGHHTRLQEFRIECISAMLSIIVGITWIILLSIGKLDDVFP